MKYCKFGLAKAISHQCFSPKNKLDRHFYATFALRVGHFARWNNKFIIHVIFFKFAHRVSKVCPTNGFLGQMSWFLQQAESLLYLPPPLLSISLTLSLSLHLYSLSLSFAPSLISSSHRCMFFSFFEFNFFSIRHFMNTWICEFVNWIYGKGVGKGDGVGSGLSCGVGSGCKYMPTNLMKYKAFMYKIQPT